jgi:hypothetical protein
MPRPTPLLILLLWVVSLSGTACDSDPVTAPTDTTPVAITETFPGGATGILTPNGGHTYPFAVQRAGTVTVVLTTLIPEGTSVGLTLGTWNGTACAAPSVDRDTITQGQSVVGSATATGNYCVRIFDAAGSLTQPAEYQITVTHF